MSTLDTLDTLVTVAKAGGLERVYKLNAVPPRPGYPYAVLSSSSLAPDVRTLDGSGNDPQQFTGQIFGQTNESTADYANRMKETFDAAYLPLPGDPQCWLELATGPTRDPDDDGVLYALHRYRF